MKKHEIRQVFFIKDRELIIIHLKDFEWDFKNFGVVYLCYDGQRVKMNYMGFGNHEGNPTLSLKLDDSRYSSLDEIESELTNKKKVFFLER
jgi:hypothetical protein